MGRTRSLEAAPKWCRGNMAAPADDPARVGEILRAVEAFKDGPVVHAALRLLLFCRPGELRTMRWEQLDLVARTILHERLGFPAEVIEHQLAHAVPDALGRAYNRTRFIAERRAMMQRWSDYLDALRAGSNVVPLRRPVASA